MLANTVWQRLTRRQAARGMVVRNMSRIRRRPPPRAPPAAEAPAVALTPAPGTSWTWSKPVLAGAATKRLPEHTAAPQNWTWSSSVALRPEQGAPEIEVKRGVPLTVEEVTAAMERLGATDIRVVPLAHKTDMFDAFVFCTGRTPRHMRALADVVVAALKQRRLKRAMGITGAEGYDCDDWMLVDCDNLVVHIFEEAYRKELDLERHWEQMRPHYAWGGERLYSGRGSGSSGCSSGGGNGSLLPHENEAQQGSDGAQEDDKLESSDGFGGGDSAGGVAVGFSDEGSDVTMLPRVPRLERFGGNDRKRCGVSVRSVSRGGGASSAHRRAKSSR